MVELNNDSFDKAMKEQGWKVVQFYAPSCVMCRLNKQILENNEERLGVKLCYVNGMNNPELVSKFQVTKAPTVFVVSPDGVFTQLADGLQGKQLLDGIKDVMGIAYEH